MDIPVSALISSNYEQIDPKKHLKEAGYPFNHIATELTELDGKFEIVSQDVRLLKEEFHKQTSDLSSKIEKETGALAKKIEESEGNTLEKVEILFDKKLLRFVGIIIGTIPILYGGLIFLQGTSLKSNSISFIAALAGIIILILSFILTKTHKLRKS